MTNLYHRILAAWETGSPTLFHRMVEGLANEGHSETAIYDELEKLLLKVREAGADDDTEETIHGVMDRLTGWCHVSAQIHTNPTAAPNIDDIARLPYWARVAFAARCAKRAIPIMFEHWPKMLHPEVPPPDTITQVLTAIMIAESAADKAVKPTSDIQRTLYAMATSKFFGNNSAGIVASVVLSAAQAVGSAESSVPVGNVNFIFQDDGGYTDIPFAFEAAMNSIQASISVNWESKYVQSVRRDIWFLRTVCDQQGCTDDTPVPPEVFGPLWPEGAPQGWPADPTTPVRTILPLTLLVGENATSPDVIEEMSNLFDAFNQYYIARTGDRLTPEGDIYTSLAVRNPVGVS